jgi:hypothetical protein
VSGLPITLTCADDARVMPLATGEVKPEGIALTLRLGGGSIWYRHFLRFVGVAPEAVEWWIGDIDTPWSPTPMDQTLPAGVKAPPRGRSLAEMLIAGELEAIYSPPLIAADDGFAAAQRGSPYATPWLEAALEDTVGLMGEDVHADGFERNRAQIDMFAGEAFRLGLTSRRITADEYFADYLQGA